MGSEMCIRDRYKTDPKIETITGGGTANIVIPFSFDEGRPTSYKVKVLED